MKWNYATFLANIKVQICHKCFTLLIEDSGIHFSLSLY
jgi:RNase P subunit RPR2